MFTAKSLDNSDLGALRVEEGPPQYEHKERAMDERGKHITFKVQLVYNILLKLSWCNFVVGCRF